MIDNKKIQEIIDTSQYGEYDSNHEWNASYTTTDKLNWLEGMLKEWEQTDAEGRKLITAFIRMILGDAWVDLGSVIDRLELYAAIPEVARVLDYLKQNYEKDRKGRWVVKKGKKQKLNYGRVEVPE
ncbi:MAG: hypothetical protein WC890_00055 [Candidatus Margulisiibacteriota bacterium]